MNKRRRLLLEQYGKLYQRHMECDPYTCFYCGEPRECLDHRPPLDIVDAVGVERLRNIEVPLVLIPSCAHCNTRLGNRHLLHVIDAVIYLRKYMERMYERKHSRHAEDELDELGWVFKTMAKANLERDNVLLNRVRHLQHREFDYDAMPVYSRFFDGGEAPCFKVSEEEES